jgi:hypothetical protein
MKKSIIKKSRKVIVMEYIKNNIFKGAGIPKKLEFGESSRYDTKICLFCWQIINHPIFSAIILMLIISNTLILATDSYPPPEDDLINRTNTFFMIAFSVECVLKLVGLEMEEYVQDKFNIFDLIIVLFSIIELFFSA